MGLFSSGSGFFGSGSGFFGGGSSLFGGSLFGSGSGSGGSSSGSSSGLKNLSKIILDQTIIIDGPDSRRLETPEWLKERARNSKCPVIQIAQAIDDAHEEFKELMTEGVPEMVLKGNDDWESSFEKREKAEKIKQKATERYNLAHIAVNEQINAMNEHIQRNQKLKRELLHEIEGVYPENSNIGLFRGHDVDEPYMRVPDMFEALENAFLGKSDSDLRKEYVAEYLEDAKDYSVQMASKTAELHTISARIASIEAILSEEDVLLEGLKKSLSMDRAFEYRAIADRLHALVRTYVVTQTGDPNSVYQTTLAELKALCS